MESNLIIIKGARENNLQNIDIELKRNQFIVITGVSGSGKTSLAFDTIYAEGQRRYVESLSTYARQFLGQMEKPDVDYISGLSPAISIEQKTTHRNPRSTVATITEIYDYLRLLYARCGIAHCYICQKVVKKQSIDQIIKCIFKLKKESKLQILSPLIQGKKGEFKKEFENIKKKGFLRIRVNGKIFNLDEEIKLKKQHKHTIEVVVDRIKLKKESRERLADSIETALKLSNGLVTILYEETDNNILKEQIFSEHMACFQCEISIPELEPRLFSFNSPYGACPKCHGLGESSEFDSELIIPDKSLSLLKGAIVPIKNLASSKWYRSQFESLAKHYNFKLTDPLNQLDKKIIDIILYGSGNEKIEIFFDGRYNRKKKIVAFEGIIPIMKRSNKNKEFEYNNQFMKSTNCSECLGKRLKKESLAVKINKQSIIEMTEKSIEEILKEFESFKIEKNILLIADKILKEIKDRLTFLKNVGLGYLSLNRKVGTLSGGEMQRIRLATQIGSQLVGVLYVLDEPSIGLHQKDNQKLIETLIHLKNLGNTLIVVEHDEQIMINANEIVDLGPGAGIYGGKIIAKGNAKEISQNKKSLTGKYLSKKLCINLENKTRIENSNFIRLTGCNKNNLKNIDVDFPLSKLIAITGVSGSGKSTLINETLYPALINKLKKSHQIMKGFKTITGYEHIDKIINIDQNPIGKTPRSNPATYIGFFNVIRELFSELPESKIKGYKAGRFSFNVKGGRCESCQGQGTVKIEMHFLADIYLTCQICKSKRYNKETLEVNYKGLNISDILNLSVDEALKIFENIPSIMNKLKTLYEIGLGYIKLGQNAKTLSGGEAQRIKLANELSKRGSGKTFYLLDEPTTGLHFDDVNKLMKVLNKLVEKGNTVLIIEHNMEVIQLADHIIDLGPNGGNSGGYIIDATNPINMSKNKKSHTGFFLSKNIIKK